MIELIEDHDPAARQPWPEVFKLGTDDIIDATVREDQLELQVRILVKEPPQVCRHVEIMDVDYVVQTLRADQPHQAGVVFAAFAIRHELLLLRRLRPLEPVEAVHQR